MMQLVNRVFIVLALFLSLPLLAAEKNTPIAAAKVGAYTVKAAITDLVGEASAQSYTDIMPIDESIGWEVYVPATYDPKKPAGVLVYISPTDSGKLPNAWKELIDKYNLIWVAANKSGNKIGSHRRLTYAVMALAVVDKRYNTDRNRIYLSGFSGGGRIASHLAIQYPSLFKGAIYNCGANRWDKNAQIALDQIKQNRYVFVTGSNDFNLDDTKRVFRSYRKAGIEQSKLMVIAGMGHSNPNKNNYEKAIKYLDQRPKG